MISVISIIRLLIFLISICGFVVFIIDKTKLRIEFAPIIVFSSITCIIYLAGLLNVMLYATYAVGLAGVILFFYASVQKKLYLIFNKNNINIRTIFIIVAFCYFTVFLQGAKFTYYDDFSHWGVVAKDMLVFDRLPNLQYNPEYGFITFITYPPGSSLFIYFTCKVIGFSEGRMMMAQIYLMLACIFSISGISRDKKYTSIVVIFASVFMLIGSLGFTTLMVDTLLPLIAIAATVIIYHHRKDVKKASLFALPINIVLVLVKNSGIFFAAVNGLLLLFYAMRKGKYEVSIREKRLNYAFVFGFILLAFFMLFLWNQHVNLVFPNAISKHSMSLKNYKNVFGEKTKEEVLQIIQVFVAKMFSLQDKNTLSIVLANAGVILLIATCKFIYKKNMKGLFTALICADTLFLLYQAGSLGMYLFSMPTGEALRLAGYYRYVSSINIYIIGILVIGFSHDFVTDCFHHNHFQSKLKNEKGGNNSFKSICMVLMIGTIIICGNASIHSSYDKFYRKLNYSETVPGKYDSIIQENIDKYSNTHYLVYAPGELNSYVAFVGKYKTLSLGVKVIDTVMPEDEFLDLTSKYYYFIVLKEDEQIIQLLSQYIDREDYVGIYKSADLFQKRID